MKTGTRLLAIALTATLASGVLNIPSADASAGRPAGCARASTEDATAKLKIQGISDTIAQLRQTHASADQMSNAIAHDFCLTQLRPQAGTESVQPFTDTNGDVNVDRPSLFKDGSLFYVIAYMNWEDNDWAGDVGSICDGWQHDGNDEGFGVALSGAVHWTNYFDEHQDITGAHGPYKKTTATTASASGVAFENVDTIFADGGCAKNDYSFYYGDIVGTFTKLNGCMNVDARASYEHTWDSAAITSISLGISDPPYLEFSVSPSNNHWTATSQTSGLVYVC